MSPLSLCSSLWVLFIGEILGEILGGPLHDSVYWELDFQDHTVELATLPQPIHGRCVMKALPRGGSKEVAEL